MATDSQGNSQPESRSREEELLLLSKLSLELSGADTLEKLTSIVTNTITGVWAWDACILSIQRSGIWFQSLVQIDTFDGEKRDAPGQLYRFGARAEIEPVLKGKWLLINRRPGEKPSELRLFGNQKPSASLIYVPVRAEGQAVGIFTIQSYTPNQYGQRDVDLLQRIADSLGPALKRCEAEKRSQVFASLGLKLSVAANQEDAARVILEAADHLLSWDAATFDVYSPKQDKIYNILNFDLVDNVRTELPPYVTDDAPMGVLRKTIDEGPQLLHRRSEHTKVPGVTPAGDSSQLSRSLMFVPIPGISEKVIGVLTIQSHREQFYSEPDLQVLQKLAEHCSGALERIRAWEEMRRFAHRLERNNRELQEFAYGASHDLQEPLTKIAAFGERLKAVAADTLSDRALDYLGRMQSAAERMRTLVRDLLSLTRITSSEMAFADVDLDEILEGVLTDLEVRIEQTHAVIRSEHLMTIRADPVQMRQLFQNLISNAIKFAKTDVAPLVKISANLIKERRTRGLLSAGRIYQITFADNGIGFEEKYAERIFGVFQRLHGRDKYEGSGIGLAVCRRIAERHHGSIIAKGVPGEGATFILSLPLDQQTGEESV